MTKRTVIDTDIYYGTRNTNYVNINPMDDIFSKEKQVEVLTKYGVVKVELVEWDMYLNKYLPTSCCHVHILKALLLKSITRKPEEY